MVGIIRCEEEKFQWPARKLIGSVRPSFEPETPESELLPARQQITRITRPTLTVCFRITSHNCTTS